MALPVNGASIFASTHSTRHFRHVFHGPHLLAKFYRVMVACVTIVELDGAIYQFDVVLAQYLFEICPFQ